MSDDRKPADEIYEIFADNEVILTWRPAKPCPADDKPEEQWREDR